jgi:hypothetical protein
VSAQKDYPNAFVEDLPPLPASIMANAVEIAKSSITAFNDRDWSRRKGLYASDAVYDEKATNRRIQGPEQIIDGLQMWATAFADATGTIVRELVIGDIAVLELLWTGTHWPAANSDETHSGVEPRGPTAGALLGSGRWRKDQIRHALFRPAHTLGPLARLARHLDKVVLHENERLAEDRLRAVLLFGSKAHYSSRGSAGQERFRAKKTRQNKHLELRF